MNKDANSWLCTRRFQFSHCLIDSKATNDQHWFMNFFFTGLNPLYVFVLPTTNQSAFSPFEGSPSFIPRLMKYHLHSESQLPSWGFAMGQQSSNIRVFFLNLYIHSHLSLNIFPGKVATRSISIRTLVSSSLRNSQNKSVLNICRVKEWKDK